MMSLKWIFNFNLELGVKMKELLSISGQTPLVKLQLPELAHINLFAKLEYYNPTGSIKDRAASYILKTLLQNQEIKQDTTIIESSSGNFGIALAAACRFFNLKFCCVIDPNITKINELILKATCDRVIKVSKPDEYGGYLRTRIETVKDILKHEKNIYWINQYGNPYNRDAYQRLGDEICDEITDIDYIFVAVSSGGTISGISKQIKSRSPNTKIIAVDSEGSVIFGEKPQKRKIPGIGSSIVPEILKDAKIDDVVIIDENSTISMCNYMLKNQSMFIGGSSGTVMSAVLKYFNGQAYFNKPNVVVIFPDKGDRYIDIIYK